MRTTLILNEEVAAAAKELAARRRTTFSAIVNEALRRVLAEDSRAVPEVRYRMPVFGGRGSRSMDTTPAELDAFLDAGGP